MATPNDKPKTPNNTPSKPLADDLEALLAKVRELRAEVKATLRSVSKQPQSVQSVDLLDALRRELLSSAFDIERATNIIGNTAKDAIAHTHLAVGPSPYDGAEWVFSTRGQDARRARSVAEWAVDALVCAGQHNKRKESTLTQVHNLACGGTASSQAGGMLRMLDGVVRSFLQLNNPEGRDASEGAESLCHLLAAQFGPAFEHKDVQACAESIITGNTKCREFNPQKFGKETYSRASVLIWREALRVDRMNVHAEIREQKRLTNAMNQALGKIDMAKRKIEPT
jgi:hypothetical protein